MPKISKVNLIVEQGNTCTKAAVCHRDGIEAVFMYKDFDCSALLPLLEQYKPVRGIFSSVTGTDAATVAFLKERLQTFILFDKTTRVPLQVGYDTPETLGRDRLAAAVGASYLHPSRDLLVIDAGTAITFELIEASGLYVGGNISPGLTTRFKALNFYTKRLPLVTEQEDVPLIGRHTEEAVRAGVVNGMVYEIRGYMETLRERYPDLLVFLTGGHSFYFERRLKKHTFAGLYADINLVLTGLNRILEYNVEN
ncbi:Type III pantothenate kinase [Bacteroidales bacterium Barb6XT]|nr:Type III pantothenate kinase [Bacteroidales bacterium Barb6XT]